VSELDQVTLNAGDKSVVLPVLKPTLGNDCVDISKLTKETGLFTYDSGFTATASCKSARSEERRVGKECRSRWSPYH